MSSLSSGGAVTDRVRRYRHAAELVGGAAVGAVFTMATIVYVGRSVRPSEYADYAAGLTVIYFVTLTFAPVTPTVARLVAQRVVRGGLPAAMALRSAVLSRVVICAVAMLVLAFAIIPIAAQWLKFRSWLTLMFAVVAALMYAILSVDRGLLQGLMRFREYNANTIIEASVRAVATGLLLAVYRSAAPAIFAYVIALAVAQIVMTIRIGRSHTAALADRDEVLKLAGPMMLLMITIAIFQNTDLLAVKRWLPATDSGFYGAAGALNRGFGVIFAPLYILAGPVLTNLRESGQPVFKMTLQLAAAFVALSSVPLILFMVWPQFIVEALYGAPYGGAGVLLAPLAGVTVMTFVSIMFSQALITVGDFSFLRAFLLCAVLQAIALMFFHRRFSDVFMVLYLSQGLLFVSTCGLFYRATTRATA